MFQASISVHVPTRAKILLHCSGNKGRWSDLCGKSYCVMTPGEIRACCRLYAAHRKSHEICTFPEPIPVINNAGDPDDLAVVLRLHPGLEGLAREIGQGDPNDHLSPSAAGHVGHLRKIASLTAIVRFRRSGGARRHLGWPQL